MYARNVHIKEKGAIAERRNENYAIDKICRNTCIFEDLCHNYL